MEGSIRRVPAMEDAAGQEVLQRPRGVHARRRVHPGRVRGARLLGRRGLLRPRPRRRGRHRQGHGGVDRRGPAGVGSLAHGHPPLRPPVPLPELHAGAHDRGLLDLLRHQVPGRGAPGRAPAARLAGVRAAHARTAPASARSPAGSASTGSTRTSPAATRSCGRAAGPGQHWSPAIEAECLAASERAVLIDQSSFAKLDVHGPGRLRVPRPHVREHRRPPARLGHLHAAPQPARRHRGRRHARAARARPLPVRDGHGLRLAQPRLAAQAPARGRLRLRRRHHVVAHVLLPLGAARARHPAAADEERPLERGVPLHARAGDRRRRRCRCSPRA